MELLHCAAAAAAHPVSSRSSQADKQANKQAPGGGAPAVDTRQPVLFFCVFLPDNLRCNDTCRGTEEK